MGGLKNRIAISGKIPNKTKRRKDGTLSTKEGYRNQITTSRNRSQGSIQVGFITDSAQTQERSKIKKDRFASRRQEIGDSGGEIDQATEAQREEDHVSEIGTGSHSESEIVPDDGGYQERKVHYKANKALLVEFFGGRNRFGSGVFSKHAEVGYWR